MKLESFEISLRFSQKIKGIERIHLSLSQYVPLAKKEVLYKNHTIMGRLTQSEHLTKLVQEGRIKDLNKPLMVISARNVLSNLRSVAYIRGFTNDGLARVAEEITDIKRPYHVLGEKIDGSLRIEEFNPSDVNIKNDFAWFVSGVPVLWDEADEKGLFERIVTEASDHSHVWHIPRGNHPKVADESRKTWQDLQNIFIETLGDTRNDAFVRLKEYAEEKQLKREDRILHNVLGIGNDGFLYQLIAAGQLEDLGKQIKKQGAKRAIVVDNSGSLAVQFYPNGINGECNMLIAAPNHRPRGTAYLVIEIEDNSFVIHDEKCN